MAWQDEQSPWGKGGKAPLPEDIIAELLKKLKQAFGGGTGGPPPGAGGIPDDGEQRHETHPGRAVPMREDSEFVQIFRATIENPQ